MVSRLFFTVLVLAVVVSMSVVEARLRRGSTASMSSGSVKVETPLRAVNFTQLLDALGKKQETDYPCPKLNKGPCGCQGGWYLESFYRLCSNGHGQGDFSGEIQAIGSRLSPNITNVMVTVIDIRSVLINFQEDGQTPGSCEMLIPSDDKCEVCQPSAGILGYRNTTDPGSLSLPCKRLL